MNKVLPGSIFSDCELSQTVTLFLYREARILDQHRYRDWLGLLADDIQYLVICGQTGTDRLALLDDDRASLEQRVLRLETGRAWAEQPPSLTQRLISNVEARWNGEDVEAFSAVMLYRSRSDNERDLLVGRREDILRSQDKGLEIVRRKVVLADTVLPSKNLSTFL